MTQLIAWTDIPVDDMERAKEFYSKAFGISFNDMQIAGFSYAIMDFKGDSNSASLTKGRGYKPSQEGTTIYLNAAPDMDPILVEVKKAGGTVVMEKTYLSPEAGYVAFIIDTEGNRIGLQHS